ncbi:hypothetical protein HPB52_022096 [Rhipicephalus sanguineus]|uniref:DUF659 domain-containing protein n=1 Tax=Rhipicephalus sanguineus TaxID=34632 RepID=A0A9D4PFZ1_RHISA|nr:hypothetical protein HPB52_022096 [Rhipicephalus sanguineus]
MVTDPAKKPYDRIREHLMSSRHKKFKTASKEAETAGTSQQTLFDMSCRQRAKETEADGVIHDFVRALAYSGISMHQADGPLGDFARKYCKAAKTMPTGQRLRLKYLKEAFDKDMEKIRDDMRDVKVSVIVDESPDITGVPTINTLLCYYSQKNVKKHVVLVDVDRVNASNSYTVASAVSKALLTVGKTCKDVVAVATDSAEYMRKMVREICQAEGIQILHVKDIAHLIHCYPPNGKWIMMKRNYPYDPYYGGNARCVLYDRVGPYRNYTIPARFSWCQDGSGRGCGSVVGSYLLSAIPGYWARNLYSFYPNNGHLAWQQHAIYKDCSTCYIGRYRYALNGYGCVMWRRTSSINRRTDFCDFIFEVFCGAAPKYQVFEPSCLRLLGYGCTLWRPASVISRNRVDYCDFIFDALCGSSPKYYIYYPACERVPPTIVDTAPWEE